MSIYHRKNSALLLHVLNMTNKMSDTANISKITHGSTEDGRGIRTVVFFGGCGLGCRWCHNPECIPPEPILMHFENKCISCGQCVKICREVFGMTAEGIVIDRTKCDGCGKCISHCLGDALAISQCKMTFEKIFEEIEKDKSYYKYSGGGVTFSGGECLMQPKMLKSLLKKCATEGINTCIESCFDVPYEVIEGIYQYVNSFFIDIKHMDPDIHRYYTGRGNGRILSNIRKIFQNHGDITFRIPLIPGVNDSMENLEKSVDFVASLKGKSEKRIEVLKYNDLAVPKYRSIGRNFVNFGKPQNDDELSHLKTHLNSLYENVKVI